MKHLNTISELRKLLADELLDMQVDIVLKQLIN